MKTISKKEIKISFLIKKEGGKSVKKRKYFFAVNEEIIGNLNYLFRHYHVIPARVLYFLQEGDPV